MAKYLRHFICNECGAQAELDPMYEGATIVVCPKCDTAEIWTSEDVFTTMQNFSYQDQAMAEC